MPKTYLLKITAHGSKKELAQILRILADEGVKGLHAGHSHRDFWSESSHYSANVSLEGCKATDSDMALAKDILLHHPRAKRPPTP